MRGNHCWLYRLALLSLVQYIHRALVCILNRAAEAEGIRDDHGEGDRGHECDQKAVLHEVLTPLVPDELLRELEHAIQPSLKPWYVLTLPRSDGGISAGTVGGHIKDQREIGSLVKENMSGST